MDSSSDAGEFLSRADEGTRRVEPLGVLRYSKNSAGEKTFREFLSIVTIVQKFLSKFPKMDSSSDAGEFLSRADEGTRRVEPLGVLRYSKNSADEKTFREFLSIVTIVQKF